MKQNLLFILLLFLCFTNYAQKKAPNIKWQNSLGGTKEDAGLSIISIKNGRSVAAGYSDSKDGDVRSSNHGGYDMWIVMLNNKGQVEKEKNFGGSCSDYGNKIKQTDDGGYIIAGSSCSADGDVGNNNGSDDGWLVKLDSSFNIQWQKDCGGSAYDYLTDVVETFDNCFVTLGQTNSNDHDIKNNHGSTDCWITKFSNTGNILWSQCFGGSNEDYGYSIIQTKDSGFIFLAATLSKNGDVSGKHGEYDCWVVKLNKKGTIEWQKCYGGNYSEFGYSIKQTIDGGYIFCAEADSNNGDVTNNHGGGDYWVVKINAIGDIEWQKCYGGSLEESARDIKLTADGGYVIAGFTNSNDGDVTYNHSYDVPDYWIIKINAQGVLQWQKSYGGSAADIVSSMDITPDGAYLITGQTYSDDGDVKGFHEASFIDAWTMRLYPDKGPADPFTFAYNQQTDSLSKDNVIVYFKY
jgi:hypothetical protein